nr:MAG TPA: hypothetical protein [Caudoviricetes sp.]
MSIYNLTLYILYNPIMNVTSIQKGGRYDNTNKQSNQGID